MTPLKLFGVIFAVGVVGVLAAVPSVPLKNSAAAGMTMPAIGLGTGGYGLNPLVGYNGYPECWVESVGCGNNTARAVETWLRAGGRRLDSADSYFNQASVGRGIADSGVPRGEMFVLSKVGSTNPLGYNDTLSQFASIKEKLGTDYVDTLLVHWPTYKPNALSGFAESTDPFCNHTSPSYNEVACRASTWKAMVQIYKAGGAKSIGVSNYNISHIEEFIKAGSAMPTINQIPINPYTYSSQQSLISYCKSKNVLPLAYSPLGIPDWHKFPAPLQGTVLEEPKLMAIAEAHKRTPAEIILANTWSMGIPSNPRSMNLTHMQMNMNIFDIQLTAAEKQTLSSFPQDGCDIDPSFYECGGTK